MHQPPQDQMIAALRSALHHLYDPVHLRSSPLVPMLGLAEEPDRAATLQAKLIAAIQALKPSDAVDPQSRAWRVYDLLHFQYVRQLGREAVAMQLGISMRQLRREQRSALEALAQQFHLPLDCINRWANPMSVECADQDIVADRLVAPTEQALSQELIWLTKGVGESTVPLHDALCTVQQSEQPLADQWKVDL